MAVSPHGKFVAIGNITGIVRVFNVSTCEETGFSKLYEGKVFGLVWVDTDHLLTTGPEGDMLVLSMPGLKTRARLFLPACKQRWASAGVLCLRKGASPSVLNGKVEKSRSVLVCGDRGGTVHCYDVIDDSSEEPCLPMSSFGKIHGKAGVTDVCYHDNRVYTSGRDGRYRQWEVTETGLHLRTTHRVMKGMDWVDRVRVSDEDTLIYGFQSSHFALWSVGENLKLVSVECGGGHRTWDCQLDAGRAKFVYLKTKHILVCDTTCSSRQIILKESLHGRELSDVKHLTTFRDSTGQLEHLVATCSEDTTVQLSIIYSAGPGLTDLKVEHTLQGHLSTVKTLAVSCSLSQPRSQSGGSVNQAADGNHGNEPDGYQGDGSLKEPTQGVIMFSGGGRAQIQIWRMTLKHFSASDVQREKHVSENSQVCNKKDQVSDDRQKDESIFSDQKNLVQTHENRSHCSEKDSESNYFSPVSGGGEDISSKLSLMSGVSCSYEHLGSMFLCGERTRRGSVQSDPETRVMCLTALCLRDVSCDYSRTVHILAAACSDSYLRIFGFNENSKSLTLLQQSGYHDNCVLKVSHIISNSKVIIISGASEGKIAFWDISQLCFLYAENVTKLQTLERQNKSTRHFVKTLDTTLKMDFKPVAMVTVHQSGLNSIHCYSCGGGRHLVASGGDDNCLSVTSICVQETADGSCVQIQRCIKNINAHAAQITGVWVLSPDCVVSASIDQRLCVWDIPHTDQKPFKMLGCRYVHISDISSMDVWKEGCEVYLYVCGQGLSVIKLDIS